MSKRKTLLIGWDAADWQILNPLIDSGKMPALSGLINEGVIGNIATLEPVISPILWNSIATGKFGDKHRILGFTESQGMAGGIRPVLSSSRKTKAIWNILQQNEYKVHQVGWWASFPAEPLNGISVSEFYGKIKVNKGEVVPAPDGSIHPAEYAELFNQFRLSPYDISGELLSNFIPELEKIDQSKDKSLIQIAESLVECTNFHSAATWILENEEWDFLSIYFQAIDTICHRFMKFYPPQLAGISDNDFNIYKHVVDSIYIYHDMMLERLLKLTGPDVTVVLVSDHGFNSGDQRMLANPKEPAGVAYDHRAYGIFLAKGPGIKKDERVYGASLLDVTPTILTACGLPIGEDMDGKALVQIFEDPVKLEYIESWDKCEGNSGMFKGDSKIQHFTTREELQQLIDLGYIDDPGDDIVNAVQQTTKESKFNLARIYLHSHRYEKAIAIFEELTEAFPDEPRFKIRLASTLQRIGKHQKCQKLLEELKEQAKPQPVEESEKPEKGKHKRTWKIPMTVISMLEANNLLSQNKPLEALKIYEKLEGEMPVSAKVNIQKARAYMAMFKHETAAREFQKSLEKDPDNASAWVGVANCYLITQNYEEATDAALNAIGQTYFYPRAHYILGQALFKLEDYVNAINALEICLLQNPVMGKARNLLIKIYSQFEKNDEALSKHINYFEEKDKDSVIIVSGIPRSGTSLMMQMLEAGGFSVITDKKREADVNNPKGYYEFEKTKKLGLDNSWLVDAKGKVIKIVSQLLFQLPDNLNYKVVFMKRNLNEVVHSQQKMVSNLKNQKLPEIYPSHLEIAYEKNLERVKGWHENNSNVQFQYINYSELISNPDESLNLLETFFNIKLDRVKMKSVIDVNLYRSKFEKIK